MIYNVKYNIAHDRKEILNYLKNSKENNPKFSLIDIGSYFMRAVYENLVKY